MRVLTGFLAAVALAVPGVAAAERMLIAAPVELRAGPDALYLPERGLARGSAVDVVERSGGWAMVLLPDGMEGWVPARALARSLPKPAVVRAAPVAEAQPEVRPEPVAAPYTTVVWPKSGTLNLRSGPGTDHAVVRKLERGDWVEVSERAGPWVKLRHPSGDEGWAHKAYLTR